MAGEYSDVASEIEDTQKDIEKMKAALAGFNTKTDKEIIQEYDIDVTTSYGRSIYDDYAQVSGKDIKELRENYGKAIKDSIANEQKTIQRSKGKMETIANVLKRYGVDDAGNMATVERVRKRYSEEAKGYTEQIAAIENNRKQYIQEATKKIKEETKPGVSVDIAVAKNTADVSHNLYSMEVVKERGMKKSLVIWRNRIYCRVS